jgi:hypothetical protein
MSGPINTRGLHDPNLHRRERRGPDPDIARQIKLALKQQRAMTRLGQFPNIQKTPDSPEMTADHIPVIDTTMNDLSELMTEVPPTDSDREAIDGYFRMAEYVPETPDQLDKQKKQMAKQLAKIVAGYEIAVSLKRKKGVRVKADDILAKLRKSGEELYQTTPPKKVDWRANQEISMKEKMAYQYFGLNPKAVREQGFVKTLLSPFLALAKPKVEVKPSNLFDTQRKFEGHAQSLARKADPIRDANKIRYGHGDPKWEKIHAAAQKQIQAQAKPKPKPKPTRKSTRAKQYSFGQAQPQAQPQTQGTSTNTPPQPPLQGKPTQGQVQGPGLIDWVKSASKKIFTKKNSTTATPATPIPQTLPLPQFLQTPPVPATPVPAPVATPATPVPAPVATPVPTTPATPATPVPAPVATPATPATPVPAPVATPVPATPVPAPVATPVPATPATPATPVPAPVATPATPATPVPAPVATPVPATVTASSSTNTVPEPLPSTPATPPKKGGIGVIPTNSAEPIKQDIVSPTQRTTKSTTPPAEKASATTAPISDSVERMFKVYQEKTGVATYPFIRIANAVDVEKKNITGEGLEEQEFTKLMGEIKNLREKSSNDEWMRAWPKLVKRYGTKYSKLQKNTDSSGGSGDNNVSADVATTSPETPKIEGGVTTSSPTPEVPTAEALDPANTREGVEESATQTKSANTTQQDPIDLTTITSLLAQQKELDQEQLEVLRAHLKIVEGDRKIDKDSTDADNENARRVAAEETAEAEGAHSVMGGVAKQSSSQQADGLSPNVEESPESNGGGVGIGVMAGLGAASAVKMAKGVIGRMTGTKTSKDGKVITTAAKETTEEATKAAAKKGTLKAMGKTGLKSAIKKVPVFGLMAASAFAAKRLYAGDREGAALEMASGMAGTLPGIGTAASLGIDAGLAARDMKQGSVEGIKRPPVVEKEISAPVENTQQAPTVINNTTNNITQGGGGKGGSNPTPILVRPTENSFLRYQERRMTRLM